MPDNPLPPSPSDPSPLPADQPANTVGNSDVARLAPTPRLSAQLLTTLLVLTCLIPLIVLSGYAAFFGKARDASLEVEVLVGREPVEAVGGQGAILTDVIVLRNLTDHELPNLTIDLNSQYYLHRQTPVQPGERLVFPQQIFATKSNQRWVPGRYALTKISVTAKLPNGRRGVKIISLPESDDD